MKKTVLLNDIEYEVLDSPPDRIRLQKFDEKSKMHVIISFPRHYDQAARDRLENFMIDMYIYQNITAT